jgi:crotonobetainyl-CoA:carnitine CoA-transferase CaiB-like acyl-CoA transferase
VGDFWANDEHVRANGFAPESEHARMGSIRRWGALVRVDGGADDYGAGVLAGEQTESLLRESGRSSEETAKLWESGVVWAEAQ